jgi:hypothetical protein
MERAAAIAPTRHFNLLDRALVFQILEAEEGLSAHVHPSPAVHHLPRLSSPNKDGSPIEWALRRALAGGDLKLPRNIPG